MAPFSKSKPTKTATERWLTNAKAAELLNVGERTIKRWTKNPALQKALGAVRHGRQWRIPRPADEWLWEIQTSRNLKEAGIDLKPSWEMELRKLGKNFARYGLESYRLWLAAHVQLSLKSEGVTQEDITAILLLWQTACKILDSLPRGTEVDKLKSQFPESLRARNFSENEIRVIMSYWPEQNIFERFRAAHTLEQLEEIRRGVDTSQAVKTCQSLDQKPTAENLRPLYHKDLMTHINDTRGKLPPGTVTAHKPEDLRRVIEADVLTHLHGGAARQITEGVDAQGRTFASIQTSNAHGQNAAPAFVDVRQPQDGLKLRTFRKRHPLKKSPQIKIIAAVYGVRDSIPDVDEKPYTGKTPVRGSKLSEKSD